MQTRKEPGGSLIRINAAPPHPGKTEWLPDSSLCGYRRPIMSELCKLWPSTEPHRHQNGVEEYADDAERLMRTLANRHRLMVLDALVDGEHSLNELTQRVALPPGTLNQHLSVMNSEGLIATRRVGDQVYFSVANPAALEVLKVLHDCFTDEDAEPPAEPPRSAQTNHAG